jgi:hypothetical protein
VKLTEWLVAPSCTVLVLVDALIVAAKRDQRKVSEMKLDAFRMMELLEFQLPENGPGGDVFNTSAVESSGAGLLRPVRLKRMVAFAAAQ